MFDAAEAQISVKDAVAVLEIARSEENSTAVGETALDLLQVTTKVLVDELMVFTDVGWSQEVTKSKPISTRLLGLDGLLGGGLQRGEVTEICALGVVVIYLHGPVL